MANGKPGRPKGLPKTGGRKKGTRNKATASIREAIEAKDPIGRLFEIAAEYRAEGDKEGESKTLIAVLPYGFPRLAATQVDLAAALRGNVTLHVHPPAEK